MNERITASHRRRRNRKLTIPRRDDNENVPEK